MPHAIATFLLHLLLVLGIIPRSGSPLVEDVADVRPSRLRP